MSNAVTSSEALVELQSNLKKLSATLHEIHDLMNADMSQVGQAWQDGKYQEFMEGYKPYIQKCEYISVQYNLWCSKVLEPTIANVQAVEKTDVGGGGSSVGSSIGGNSLVGTGVAGVTGVAAAGIANGALGQTGIGSASSSNSVVGGDGNSFLKPTPFPKPSGPGSLFGGFNKGGVNMPQHPMSPGIKPTPFPEPVGGSGVLGQTGIGSASSSNSVVGGNGNSFLKPTPFPEPNGSGSLFGGYNKGGVNMSQQSMSPGIKPTPFPEPVGGSGVLGQTGIGGASSSNSVVGGNGNSLLKPTPFPEPSGSGSLSNELDVVQNNEVHRPSRIMERPKPIQVESPRNNTPQITYHQTNKRRDRFGR